MTDDLKVRTTTLNNLIDFIVNEFLEEDLSASSADMYLEFLDLYTYDGIHVNAEGSKFIANQYKEVINDYFYNNNLLPITDCNATG